MSGLPISKQAGSLIDNPQTGNYDASTTTTLNVGRTPQYFKNYGDTTVLAPQSCLQSLCTAGSLLPPPPIDFIYSFDYTGTENINVREHIPINRRGGHLQYSATHTQEGNKYTVTVSLLSFTDDNTTNDGITFAEVFDFYNNQTTNLTILKFGDIPLSRGGNQFSYLNDIRFLTDIKPYILQYTLLTGCFQECPNFNSNISGWDTSKVTKMDAMFASATSFNQPIGSWNTGAVRDMNNMFFQATAFNQPIGSWNTAAVTDMNSMFIRATAFNQPIGSWNTGAVTNMGTMFFEATACDQPIGSWNTGAVTNMGTMFYDATSFNQPIGSWDTAAVRDMNSMFTNATSFNQPIGSWNTAAVRDMSYMFISATAFNQPIGSWNTGAVRDMNSMFISATAFNNGQDSNGRTAPLGWNTTNVTPSPPNVVNFGINSGLRPQNAVNSTSIQIGPVSLPP